MNDTPSTAPGAAAAGTITHRRRPERQSPRLRCDAPDRAGHLGRAQGPAERATRAAAGAGARRRTSSTRRTLTAPTSASGLIGETLHPYPRGLVIATKGGLIRPGRDHLGAKRRPRASAPGVRREPEAAAPRAYRPLSVPRARSARAAGRFPRRAGETAAGRQDPAHRRVELQRRRAGARRTRRDCRIGPESLQRQRPTLRRRGHLVRTAQNRVHSPLAAGGGRAGGGRAAQSALAWLLARSPG